MVFQPFHTVLLQSSQSSGGSWNIYFGGRGAFKRSAHALQILFGCKMFSDRPHLGSSVKILSFSQRLQRAQQKPGEYNRQRSPCLTICIHKLCNRSGNHRNTIQKLASSVTMNRYGDMRVRIPLYPITKVFATSTRNLIERVKLHIIQNHIIVPSVVLESYLVFILPKNPNS